VTIRLYDVAGQDSNHRFSPFCWRIKMALSHKGLPFETIPWHLTDKSAIADSGQGRAPVIEDGEHTLHDSWRIACYLDSAYPNTPPLFTDASAKAHALFIKFWCERDLHDAIRPIIILDLLKAFHEKDKAYFRESREKLFKMTLERFAAEEEKKQAALDRALVPLRDSVSLNQYIGGAQPSFADFIVFGAFQWARAVSPTQLVTSSDPIYAWRDRLLDAYGGIAGKAKGYAV